MMTTTLTSEKLKMMKAMAEAVTPDRGAQITIMAALITADATISLALETRNLADAVRKR